MGEVVEAGRRERGDEAEAAAVKLLEQRGYRIRLRNFRCRYGEVDIVAEQGEVVCFVEVRMRTTGVWGDPASTVSWAKQRKVVKTAMHYLFSAGLKDRMIRFDVISVVGRGEAASLEHIPDAFDAGM